MRLEIKTNPHTNKPDAVLTIDIGSLIKIIDALTWATTTYDDGSDSIQRSKEINYLAKLIETDLTNALNETYGNLS